MNKQDKFFDRQLYLDILEKRLHDLKDGYRRNLAIIGEELVGKTSLIFNFLNKFYDNYIVFIYLEIRPEPLTLFAKRFIGVLLYNFLINSEIPLKEDLDFLINRASRYIPNTIEKIKTILIDLKKRRKNNIFTDLLSLSEILHEETGKYCVIIFDEFHNLENMEVKNIYAQWSKLLILQKNTLYIIISSLSYKAQMILSKKLSLLFGNFEILTLEPFDIKTTEEYLDNKLKDLKLNIEIKNFLVNFTGGYPFYLEIISEELLKSASLNNLSEILENLIFEPTGILNQRFSNYLKRFLSLSHSQDYLGILYSIANGHNKIRDIAHNLHLTKKDINLKINCLLELGAISRSGDFLKINDRVFSFWLKFVYQEKLHSLTFDDKAPKALFREKIEMMIQEFLSQSKKPIIDRTIELLRLFSNEIVQIERKKLRLNNFREIKPLDLRSSGLKEGLIGRSQDSLWIIAFKHDLLTEKDILEFSKECKKYRHKLQRKIIVALKDIDVNAKLRALEEKILTWDLNSFNQILDLYYKPRLIV